MVLDARQSGEEACIAQKQVVNALMLAARAAPAALKAPEDRVQKFAHFPDY